MKNSFSPDISINTETSNNISSSNNNNNNHIPQPRKPKCLICCSGSVATLKLPEIAVELSIKYEVMIICTQNALFFLERAEKYNAEIWKKFIAIGGWNIVLYDSDEWEMWNKIGNAVLHIELRRWADVLLIAPASANLIAKASVGISDNLLLSVMRAWDFAKPCILCPAMNTIMWNHPITKQSINTLKSWGWEILGPIEKVLACNDKGNGALASVESIRNYLFSKDIKYSPLLDISPSLISNSVSTTDLNENEDKRYISIRKRLVFDREYSSPDVISQTDSSSPSFFGKYLNTDENNGDHSIMNNLTTTANLIIKKNHPRESIMRWINNFNFQNLSLGLGLGLGIGLSISSLIILRSSPHDKASYHV